MKVYEIIKSIGCGVIEFPTVSHPTGILFNNKESAELEANKLWVENTTKKERESGWCPLHYYVNETEVRP